MLLLVLLLPAPVLGHAGIEPREAVAERRLVLTLLVPAEVGPVAEVRMKPPAGFRVDFVQAPPEWALAAERDAGGNVTRAVWKAAAPMLRGQFAEFRFRAEAPEKAGDYAWSVEEHVAGVEVSMDEEMKAHAEETGKAGAHSHQAEGNVRKWEPKVTVVAQDTTERTIANLTRGLEEARAQARQAQARADQAAADASRPTGAGLALAALAVAMAALALARRKR